jgi:APA family basic amino acid/polyamine antiporter
VSGLRRQLGLSSATAAVVGQVIALGIFLTPAGMAKSLGSPFWVLTVWLLMGGMALCGAFCYGALAARFPEAGGGYVYLRRAWGPRVAFLYGWKCLLVMDPGITAALATGLAAYAAVLVPLGEGAQKLVAIAVLAAVAAANVVGLRLGDGLLKTLTVLKLGLLAALVSWGFASGAGDWGRFAPFLDRRPGSPPLAAGLAAGVMAAFFSFGGWWEASKIAGEVRDPERTMPRALALGVAIVTVVYVAVSLTFLYLVPVETVASGETFAAQVGAVLFGPAGGKVLAAAVVFSILGGLAAVVMVYPRLYYAMARDGAFLPAMARLHPRFGTPARAIALQVAVASVLIAVSTFQEIVAYFIFVTVVFIGLTVAGVYAIDRRAKGDPVMRRIPGYPVTPAVYLALTLAVLALLAMSRPRQALIGLLVVAAGVPVYHLSGASRAPAPQSRGDRE